MFTKIHATFLACIAINLFCNSANAAVTFLVQPNKATYNPGETAVMTVYAYAPGTVDDTFLEGFRLGFDLQPDVGKGFDTASFGGFSGTFGGANGVFDAGSPSGFANSVTSANYDFRATGERDPVLNGLANNLKNTTSSNAIKLLTISFNIAATAPVGSYSFVFTPGATTSSGVYNRITLNGSQIFEGAEGFESFVAQGGAFDISGEAVPEPSTVALLALGLTIGTGYRRFRKPSHQQKVGSAET